MAAMYCRYFECEDPNTALCWQECTQQYAGSETPFYALIGAQGCLTASCSLECSKQ